MERFFFLRYASRPLARPLAFYIAVFRKGTFWKRMLRWALPPVLDSALLRYALSAWLLFPVGGAAAFRA